MVKIAQTELLELFIQEVASYIPEIRQGLAVLAVENNATASLDELHRLFHNIKGAASQVQLLHLSRGAKIVEILLADMVEENRPASAELVAVINQVTDLINEFTRKEDVILQEEELYHKIAALFTDYSEKSKFDLLNNAAAKDLQSQEKREEYILATRSVLPLLQELAEYLSPELVGGDNDCAKVYGKISKAVKTLALAARAAGLREQPLLMEDFHVLLEKIQTDELSRLPELQGLIKDFLRFLEAVYTCADPENTTTVLRVKDQLHGINTLLLLAGKGQPTVVSDDTAFADEEELLPEKEPPSDSGILLEDIAEDMFFEEEVEDPLLAAFFSEDTEPEPYLPLEQKQEPLGEEQQQLLDIFRSECEEHLIVINHSLNVLESEVTTSRSLSSSLRETLSVMRRAIHTLKGAAGMTGMSLTARSAHVLEDLLDWIHDEAVEITPGEVQILATGIDVIELVSQSTQIEESLHLDRLIETINGYLATRTATRETEEIEREHTEKPASTAVAAGVSADEVGPEVDSSAGIPGDSGILRVRLDDLDELVGIEGELVVARGAIEKMLEEFTGTLSELDTVKENLRRKSQELESGFEVQSLYGFSPRTSDDTTGSTYSEFDPIELDRYSQLNLIIRSLNEISVDINSIHGTLVSLIGDMSGQVGKQQLTMRLMQEKLMRIRMTPMSSLSRVLYRTVRETAKKLDKKANLVITGEDVYMDRFVWAKITDPLMHLLRNALDHGIESPDQRIAAGKPESGTIRVEADQRSRFVVLRISDDGCGIDLERVKEKIRTGGLAEDPDKLSEKEVLEFLFHPSFTTRQDISTISGRGIGLDVVRKNIQELRGSVELQNIPGKGAIFELRIPFTLSVNRAVMVRVAGRVFAAPMQDIQQVRRFSAEELQEKDGQVYLRFGDGFVPVVNLGYCLQLESKSNALPTNRSGILAILFSKGEELMAVSVDEIVEQREIVVKGLGSHLTHVPGISGVTFTGSGDLIPIINLREISETEKPEMKAAAEAVLQSAILSPLKVLIVDDSISVRHSVARLVESQGWLQQQAIDGVDALAILEEFVPDVIVLDIEMPRMNGYEFKSKLNNDSHLKDIPVIMLTSRSSEKHQQKANDLGVRQYMTKPYQEETFIRVLEKIRS